MNASTAISEALVRARDALRVWGFSSQATDPETLILEALALQTAISISEHENPEAVKFNKDKHHAAVHGEAIWTVATLMLHQIKALVDSLKVQDVDGAICAALDLGSSKMTLASLEDETTAGFAIDQMIEWRSRLDKHLENRNEDWIRKAGEIWVADPTAAVNAVAARIIAETGYDKDEKTVRKAIERYRPGTFLNKHLMPSASRH